MHVAQLDQFATALLALNFCDEVRVALTDADGDFLSYAVDLVSIRLEDSNGDDIEVLDDEQRVDFATESYVVDLRPLNRPHPPYATRFLPALFAR